MRTRDSLLLSQELRLAWDWADAPGPKHTGTKLDSLLVLADNRDKLPGAVFFTVPEGATHGDSRWRKLVNKSQPYCGCWSRRVLWPTQGRSRVLADHPPHDQKRVEYRYDPVVAWNGEQYNAEPLVLAPWGGDLESAYVMFTFIYSDPIGWQLPFMKPRGEGRLVYNQANFGFDSHFPERWGCRRPRLIDALIERGEISFTQRLHDGGKLHVPTCTLTRVDYVKSDTPRGDRPVLVFQIDASVRVVPFQNVPLHVCDGTAVTGTPG